MLKTILLIVAIIVLFILAIYFIAILTFAKFWNKTTKRMDKLFDEDFPDFPSARKRMRR